MTPELTALVLAALLQFVQITLQSALMTRNAGTDYNLSPRDAPRTPGLYEGRASRALANHDTALIQFAVAALVVAVSGQSTGWTAILAWAYLAARALYVPAYVLGWVPWRSAFYVLGALATALMLLAALV